MLRVPEPGRVENRCVDGSANPYLAFAVLAAAGLDGVDRDLDPGAARTRTTSSHLARATGGPRNRNDAAHPAPRGRDLVKRLRPPGGAGQDTRTASTSTTSPR